MSDVMVETIHRWFHGERKFELKFADGERIELGIDGKKALSLVKDEWEILFSGLLKLGVISNREGVKKDGTLELFDEKNVKQGNKEAILPEKIIKQNNGQVDKSDIFKSFLEEETGKDRNINNQKRDYKDIDWKKAATKRGMPWSVTDEQMASTMWDEKNDIRDIALKLGRTTDGIIDKLVSLRVKINGHVARKFELKETMNK